MTEIYLGDLGPDTQEFPETIWDDEANLVGTHVGQGDYAIEGPLPDKEYFKRKLKGK